MTTAPKTTQQLEREVQALRHALETLIAWMAQSANSPIRIDEANHILTTLNVEMSA